MNTFIFYNPCVWELSKLHLHLNKTVAVFTVFILLPLFMKILHSFKGMVKYQCLYILFSKQLYIHCSEKSKIQALENILRFLACNFGIYENRFLYIYGGRWLGTFNKIWDVNFVQSGYLHIFFNVLKFGNYVHIKLIK